MCSIIRKAYYWIMKKLFGESIPLSFNKESTLNIQESNDDILRIDDYNSLKNVNIDSYGVFDPSPLPYFKGLDGYSAWKDNNTEEEEMTLEQKVKDVVEAFCNDLQSFTSLDVSNQVKQEGFASTRHREVARVVRELFFNDDLITDQGYEKSNIVVRLRDGSSAVAYLYHHETTDPDEYDRRDQTVIPVSRDDSDTDDDSSVQASPASRRTLADAVSAGPARRHIGDLRRSNNAPAAPTAAVAAPATTSPRVVNTSVRNIRDATTRAQKADCRLEVPVSWVSQLNWAAGDTIYAVRDTQGLTLKHSSNVDTSDEVYCVVKVNVDGRLRVPKTALDRSGITHGPHEELNVVLLDNGILVS